MIKRKIIDGEDFLIPDDVVSTEIDGDTATFYFADDQEIIDQDMLSGYRSYAMIQVRDKCAEMITSGISSSACGDELTYRSKIEDQLNIIAAALSKKGGTVTCNDGKLALNPAQISKLNDDIVDKKEFLLSDKNMRYAEIDDALTESDIKAVIEKKW